MDEVPTRKRDTSWVEGELATSLENFPGSVRRGNWLVAADNDVYEYDDSWNYTGNSWVVDPLTNETAQIRGIDIGASYWWMLDLDESKVWKYSV